MMRTSGKRPAKRFDKKENKPFRKPKPASEVSKLKLKPKSKPKASPKAHSKPKKGSEKEGVRLNKYLADAGICSRREADELIKSGVVEINGQIVIELGTRVLPGDKVKYDGGTLSTERKVYILLNKPKDYVTTVDDPQERRTVMQLIGNACKERVYPVGRLDRNTTGVLLFTNDGDLAAKLTHPKYGKKKIYQVVCDKKVTHADVQKLSEGVELEDGFIKADEISYIANEDKTHVGIEIHSGKNRIVRRMFAHLGYKVIKLDRVYFAGLTKKLLPRGKWRHLSEKEVSFLKMQ